MDDVFTVTVNGTPTVASAIADTAVAENSAPIDNYRDLKAVFTDAEDGSALTYSIQSNTNSGLVTPTIVAADSTLDLSFTASTTGTATITVRATDGGALFVDDVFTVTVLCAPATLPFSDSFTRANSNTVGNCWWEEVEAGIDDATISVNRLQYAVVSNGTNSPIISHTFTEVSTGSLIWTYVFNWDRTGAEDTYELWMQLGNSATMVDPATSDNTGVAVNLKWGAINNGMTDDEGFGYVQGGTTNQVAIVSGGPANDHTIEVIADLDANTFALKIDDVVQATDIAFDNNVSIDAVRIYTDGLGSGQFGNREFDDLTVQLNTNTAPTVAAAIPDTTVIEDSSPIDNYRDLKAVFTDAEDGSGLTYSIQSNTNAGLVTPTIVAADSTLDLSFTASTSGTATITIRAMDSGTFIVDDVFTVTVDPLPVGLVARYWMEEAASGQAPTQLLDDQTSPLNLPITYDLTNPTYTVLSTGRGWESTTTDNQGRATTLVDGTKLQTALDGATATAIEVVLAIDALSTNSSRIFHIGDASDSGYLTLSSPNATTLYFYSLGGTLRGQWDPGFDGTRAVFHLVYDSSEPTAGDRVRLYKNGVLQAKTGGTDPPLNETISVPNGKYFGIANRELCCRSFDGRMYYAAVYDGALTASEVSTNYAALLISDDSHAPPTVAAAIPDTTVIEDSSPVDNYRDLKAVFTDAEDGSGLTFTIQGNTNTGLVTPTIGADSALDLSFTASTTGTATITVRATDSGSLWVDDVFIVTVDPCPTASLPFIDDFNRGTTASVGNCWVEELETGGADATIATNRLQLSSTDELNAPRISHTFTQVSTGSLIWSYVFNWDRTGAEGTYGLWMQLGNSALMVDPATSDNTGVAVNLKWAGTNRGMTNDEGFGYVQGAAVTEVAVVSGGPANDHTIEVIADLDLNTFTLKIDDVVQASDVAFDNNVNIDAVRIYADEIDDTNFANREFDDLTIQLNTNQAPTVAAAIADTTVAESNPPIDNYRDLTAVFTDVEDGSALTFTIQSNTNPGLVTPTIDVLLRTASKFASAQAASAQIKATFKPALLVVVDSQPREHHVLLRDQDVGRSAERECALERAERGDSHHCAGRSRGPGHRNGDGVERGPVLDRARRRRGDRDRDELRRALLDEHDHCGQLGGSHAGDGRAGPAGSGERRDVHGHWAQRLHHVLLRDQDVGRSTERERPLQRAERRDALVGRHCAGRRRGPGHRNGDGVERAAELDRARRRRSHRDRDHLRRALLDEHDHCGQLGGSHAGDGRAGPAGSGERRDVHGHWAQRLHHLLLRDQDVGRSTERERPLQRAERRDALVGRHCAGRRRGPGHRNGDGVERAAELDRARRRRSDRNRDDLRRPILDEHDHRG